MIKQGHGGRIIGASSVAAKQGNPNNYTFVFYLLHMVYAAEQFFSLTASPNLLSGA